MISPPIALNQTSWLEAAINKLYHYIHMNILYTYEDTCTYIDIYNDSN